MPTGKEYAPNNINAQVEILHTLHVSQSICLIRATWRLPCTWRFGIIGDHPTKSVRYLTHPRSNAQYSTHNSLISNVQFNHHYHDKYTSKEGLQREVNAEHTFNRLSRISTTLTTWLQHMLDEESRVQLRPMIQSQKRDHVYPWVRCCSPP